MRSDSAARRSDFDVTNRVQVSDPASVSAAVQAIYGDLYPHRALKPLHTAFADFSRLYRGEDPRFHGCETAYHDMQHSLDVTLSLARHVDGYERQAKPSKRLGARRAMVGIVAALYHDVGYLRSTRDRHHKHGAEYTLSHVTRSGHFLGDYLTRLGLGSESRTADELVQYTGYERDINKIQLGDDGYTQLGFLLGTADLTTQMADRCYLEKCRDRLYDEFVMGGMARRTLPDGKVLVLYSSPRDLLMKTQGFFDKTRLDRLDGTFAGAHRYVQKFFGGQNLYMEAVQQNMKYLARVIRDDGWSYLRRNPPLFTAEEMRWKPMPQLRSQRLHSQQKRA
ncbi:MAG TPA: hypothetical protein VLV87_08265 [Gammaproteobacteria bacterium]|nr:hypothetical protein [Gammaproteobacteria bacterium]